MLDSCCIRVSYPLLLLLLYSVLNTPHVRQVAETDWLTYWLGLHSLHCVYTSSNFKLSLFFITVLNIDQCLRYRLCDVIPGHPSSLISGALDCHRKIMSQKCHIFSEEIMWHNWIKRCTVYILYTPVGINYCCTKCTRCTDTSSSIPVVYQNYTRKYYYIYSSNLVLLFKTHNNSWAT